MKELLGKIIKEIKFLEEGKFCLFEIADGTELKYEASGDCCSHSYFSDIIDKRIMLGAEVLQVIEKEERDVLPKKDEDHVVLYAYTIKTSKGYGDIEFRNDSNGYYGGFCRLIENVQN